MLCKRTQVLHRYDTLKKDSFGRFASINQSISLSIRTHFIVQSSTMIPIYGSTTRRKTSYKINMTVAIMLTSLLLVVLNTAEAFTTRTRSPSFQLSNPRIFSYSFTQRMMTNHNIRNSDDCQKDGTMYVSCEDSDGEASTEVLPSQRLSSLSMPTIMKRREVLELSSATSMLSMLLIGSIVDPKLSFAETTTATETGASTPKTAPIADVKIKF